MTLVPASVNVPETAPGDPRVGQLLGGALKPAERARVSLVGFCVDQGVERNGGRMGASEGPHALREQLFRMCPDPRQQQAFVELLAHTRDLGDLHGSGDLERDHITSKEVEAYLAKEDH